jgi:ABC-2 type transport system permease protein
MEVETQSRPEPSFSPWRRWTIGLNVAFIVLIVLVVVIMLNYLSYNHSARFYVSSRLKHELSPQTMKFLSTMTNRVKVVVYYDRNEPFYGTIVALLNEYRVRNQHISVEAVDYLRDAGAAQKVKAQYKLSSPTATNLIIFDCEGKKSVPIDGNLLTQYVVEKLPNEENQFRKRPAEFNGERMFTSALLEVTSTNQLRAYFVEGHGEHPFWSADETYGYQEFATVLSQIRVQSQRLRLDGANPIPTDGVLIIAGPNHGFDASEVRKIDDYLTQGGRLFALFNFYTTNHEIGLERLFAKWGVEISREVIKDPDQTFSGSDIIVDITNRHALVNPLISQRLQMIEPRSVGKLRIPNAPADAPQVEEVAFSGPHAFQKGEPAVARAFPLIVAVEKGAIKGVLTERGATRIVVTGDSFFLTNRQIEAAEGAHKDFVSCAVNWLLARGELLDIGPREIINYRITMSVRQLQQAEVVLVAGMPGAILLIGALVWLRRRR